jgi:hypothetical protein
LTVISVSLDSAILHAAAFFNRLGESIVNGIDEIEGKVRV